MTEIRKWNYMRSSSRNYGVNSIAVSLGDLTLWFSYGTVVAFSDATSGRKVSDNIWGPTTGKHINRIDGGNKADRLSQEKFTKEFEKCLKRHKLSIG